MSRELSSSIVMKSCRVRGCSGLPSKLGGELLIHNGCNYEYTSNQTRLYSILITTALSRPVPG